MLKSENRYKQICCYWRRTVNCDNWHAMAGFREAKGLAMATMAPLTKKTTSKSRRKHERFW